MRSLMIVLTILLGLVCPPSRAQTPASANAEQRRDALLEAMGGAAVWREVIGARISATHYSTATRLPYRNVIWNDFRRFRLHIEASNIELLRVFSYDGESGWRDDGSNVTQIAPARVAEERAWWSANVYRTLHRLAMPDPALSVRLLGDGRLAVFEQGKGLLAWVALNAVGEPLRFGTEENGPGTLFGPLASHASGARYPRWGSDSSGSWRYEVHDAEFSRRAVVMPPLPQPKAE